MEPNQVFCFVCFFKGILAMKEPPVPTRDAAAVESKVHWTTRIFRGFRREKAAPVQKAIRTEQC
ncbi:hypothetical protein DC3_33330 [Deinococcus cellulosilyticus NBRC 106333 = KACC 11606]|uniref:Uncharacterized protein n=1 Tax=Deinococcus cellulosilyticus (strain DSM 18568 / NBRC 106333 / KACC 11606 / 5516J-15) TaxID=1223518 RepID=A0A511N5D8_DEIC1|nr:hypothetical protein DC3_33330 [Deinococcus cellulosilyticus NBRC 106333 = KACC 11606]